MGEVTSGCTISESSPNAGVKRVIIEAADTVDASDTIVIKLGSYGMSATGLLGVTEWLHTTDASVITPIGFYQGNAGGASTTAVSSGVLTITIGSGTNKTHVYEIVGK